MVKGLAAELAEVAPFGGSPVDVASWTELTFLFFSSAWFTFSKNSLSR